MLRDLGCKNCSALRRASAVLLKCFSSASQRLLGEFAGLLPGIVAAGSSGRSTAVQALKSEGCAQRKSALPKIPEVLLVTAPRARQNRQRSCNSCIELESPVVLSCSFHEGSRRDAVRSQAPSGGATGSGRGAP